MDFTVSNVGHIDAELVYLWRVLLTGSCQPWLSASRLTCSWVIRLHVFDVDTTVSAWQSNCVGVVVGPCPVSGVVCCWICCETQIWLGDLRVAGVFAFVVFVVNGFAIPVALCVLFVCGWCLPPFSTPVELHHTAMALRAQEAFYSIGFTCSNSHSE